LQGRAPFARYRQMLATRPLDLHAEDLAGIGTTAAKVWESSLEQVVRSGRPLAPQLLGVLSCFAPEDIPGALLDPEAIEAVTVLGGDPLGVELALMGLAELSLVTFEHGTVGLYRVVQHLTRAKAGEDDAVDWASAAILALRSALRRRTEQPSSLARPFHNQVADRP